MAAKITKVVMSATIPTVQYGNIIPEFTIEGGTEKTMKAKGLKAIEEVWDEYCEKPLKKGEEKTEEGLVFDEILSFTGEKIHWNEYIHQYRALDGTVLTSGSAYASMGEKEFDSRAVADRTSKSWNVDSSELQDLWKMNARLSTEYGTAVHTALEMYHRFYKLGDVVQQKKELDFNYVLPKNEYLRKAVLDFVELFGADAESEVFITDVKNKMAGQIDRLQIIDMEKKICRLGDYKTNAEMKKAKLTTYTKQMSFYGQALKNHGWTVEGYDLFWFDGNLWHKYELDEVEIDMSLIK